jgi:hypothetical protein
MNDGPCAKLHDFLETPDAIYTRPDRREFLDSLTGVEGCIAGQLSTSAEEEDWGRFSRYVVAAMHHPDRSYVPILCSVLDRQLPEVNNEDVVSLLDGIADPRSVPCLVKAMWWEPDWDEYLQLAKKCVWALARIGTPEAIEALRDAATVGSDILREEAQYELNRRP